MTVNSYKCWATYATSLLKCSESNWNSYSHTGALLSSLRQQKATLWVGIGEARELQTILAFYHLLALLKWWVSRPCRTVLLQHVHLLLLGFLQAVSNISIQRLLYFFSASSTLCFNLAKGTKWNPNTVSRTLTLFNLEQKVAVFGKQTKGKSIFSTAHFIHFPASSSHTFFWLLLCMFFLFLCQISQPILNSFQ